MPSVTIDTCVFAAPPISVTYEEVLGYVETLLDWKILLREPWIAIYLSKNVSEAMLEDAVYPFRENLKVLFREKGILEYDPNTVVPVIEQLLRITPTFETYFRIHDILLQNVKTIPDILSIHTSEGLSSDLARIVVMIAILRSCCHQPILDHNLIIKPWCGGRKIEVTAQIVEIETSREDISAIPEYPDYFQGEVFTCENFKEFVQNLDETVIWQASDCMDGLEVAIKVAVYKTRIHNKGEPDWEGVQGFNFGPSFYTRMREMERSGSPGLIDRTIRAIVETLEKMSLQDVHALRINEGGGSPQRMRGKDKAWRRDIDREYHLHYWELSNGEIEFASIGPHNDFDIP